jgi:C4-dicarboxylate-specific signal transduction histidine kinase
MPASPIKILLVEDSAAYAVLLGKEFADSSIASFEMTHARRLDEALSLMQVQPFHAVLLDLELPDSHGVATLTRLQKANASNIPVVVVTAIEDEPLRVQALRAGADDYLVKGMLTSDVRARSVRYAIERKASQRAARVRETEFAHLSRVATMGQMASGLAHELNQPLAASLNYAAACLMQAESVAGFPAAVAAGLKEVVKEIRRAGAIISRMRSFMDNQEPHRVALNLNDLVHESIKMMSFKLQPHRVRPQLELADHLPEVRGDPVQIEQVLVNLLFNGIESMAGRAPSDCSLVIRTEIDANAAMVQVSIQDRGIGILPANLPRLFEPFFSTKPKGLGMGLNISRSIIESLGGQLWADPNPDRGMQFCFTVPCYKRATAEVPLAAGELI